MATGCDEVGGKIPDSLAGSEDLSELKCQPCQEDGIIREAVGMCTDCQDYLCRKCFDSHTIPKPSRKHQLLDKQQMLRSKVNLDRKDKCTKKCPLHDDKTLKYYCIEHEQISCSVCLNLDHRTCKPVQYIPDAAQNLDNNAEFKQANLCLNTTLKLCKDVSDTEAVVVESIETSCLESLKTLETHRRSVNDALDKIQAAIVKRADTVKARALEKITKITANYRDVRRELQDCQARTEQLQHRHQNCDLYTDVMQMKDRLQVLECEIKEVEKQLALQATQIEFTPNLGLLETLKNPDVFGKLTGPAQGDIIGADHVQAIDVKTANDKRRINITGSAFLCDSKLVIAESSTNNIKTVDLNQNQVVTQTELSSAPWDVCTIKKDQVAVTLPDEKKIAIVTVEGKMSVDRTMGVNGNCHGVDYKDDKLVVSFNKQNKVQVLTMNGTVLHDITTDQQGHALFNRPSYVAFDPDGTTVYVSNNNSHTVARVKLDGTLVATYKDSELQYPEAVVLDSDGNVYVCAYSVHHPSDLPGLQETTSSARKE